MDTIIQGSNTLIWSNIMQFVFRKTDRLCEIVCNTSIVNKHVLFNNWIMIINDTMPYFEAVFFLQSCKAR